MKKIATLVIVLILAACGSRSGEQHGTVATNEQRQPMIFDLKGAELGMKLEQIKAKIGDMQCRPSIDRFVELYGSDWKSNPNVKQLPEFNKQKILLIEVADQICISTVPQQLANEEATGLAFLKNGRTVRVGFIFTSSGDSVVESLGYKYGWIPPSANEFDKKFLKTEIFMALSQGYLDQKGNVIKFSSSKDDKEVSIMTGGVFKKMVSAHEIDIRNQAGVGNM